MERGIEKLEKGDDRASEIQEISYRSTLNTALDRMTETDVRNLRCKRLAEDRSTCELEGSSKNAERGIGLRSRWIKEDTSQSSRRVMSAVETVRSLQNAYSCALLTRSQPKKAQEYA